jgi:hypothetical protein
VSKGLNKSRMFDNLQGLALEHSRSSLLHIGPSGQGYYSLSSCLSIDYRNPCYNNKCIETHKYVLLGTTWLREHLQSLARIK